MGRYGSKRKTQGASRARFLSCGLGLARLGARYQNKQRRGRKNGSTHRAPRKGGLKCAKQGKNPTADVRGGETVRGFFQSAHTHFCRELYHFRALKSVLNNHSATHRLTGFSAPEGEKMKKNSSQCQMCISLKALGRTRERETLRGLQWACNE